MNFPSKMKCPLDWEWFVFVGCFEMISNMDNHGAFPITPRRSPPLLLYVLIETDSSQVKLGKAAHRNGE